jgi:benzoylformate decarboxylase
VLFVVMRNCEYAILKSFAVLEETPGVPGLDLPGLDIVSLAAGYGCAAARPTTSERHYRRGDSRSAAARPGGIRDPDRSGNTPLL